MQVSVPCFNRNSQAKCNAISTLLKTMFTASLNSSHHVECLQYGKSHSRELIKPQQF